ncbi:MAG: hybrid sensor histidine kinase/response regulator [Candidatus Magnetomorum sp.]|nr:hybrid sensor histidine kinase/response regulator [Candidatus Magnetomorum sp.]
MQKKASILVVDDTELNIDILMGILKNYDVIPALSGKEALQIVLDETIDLILLDIIMPEMDGYEVCKRLKADDRTKDIPIIFITVKHMEQDIIRGYELGIVDYVSKPFNPVALIGSVNKYLDMGQQIRKQKMIIKQLCHLSSQAVAQDTALFFYNNWKRSLTTTGHSKENQLQGTQQPIEKIVEILDNEMSEFILSFQRVYTPDMESTVFYIRDAVFLAERILSATFIHDKINLQIEEKETCQSCGSKNDFAQVILNLLSNAREVLIKRQIDCPEISIVIHKAENQSQVLIRDNSGGVDEALLDEMFDPLKSIAGHNNAKLFVARSIIEKHSGRLICKNWKMGTEFIVIL